MNTLTKLTNVAALVQDLEKKYGTNHPLTQAWKKREDELNAQCVRELLADVKAN